jgi:biotin operon repressor
MAKKSTKESILNYIEKHYKVTPKPLANAVGISRQALYIHVKALIKDEKISKIGSAPKVYYALQEKNELLDTGSILPEEDKQLLENRFYQVTSLGVEKAGIKGFEYWCAKQGLHIQKTAKEYRKTLAKYDTYKKEGGEQEILVVSLKT